MLLSNPSARPQRGAPRTCAPWTSIARTAQAWDAMPAASARSSCVGERWSDHGTVAPNRSLGACPSAGSVQDHNGHGLLSTASQKKGTGSMRRQGTQPATEERQFTPVPHFWGAVLSGEAVACSSCSRIAATTESSEVCARKNRSRSGPSRLDVGELQQHALLQRRELTARHGRAWPIDRAAIARTRATCPGSARSDPTGSRSRAPSRTRTRRRAWPAASACR